MDFYLRVAEIVQSGGRAVLVTAIDGPAAGKKLLYGQAGPAGEPGVLHSNLPDQLAAEAAEAARGAWGLSPGATGTGGAQGARYFREVFGSPPRLLILGGGHIALSLCQMAHLLGYRIVVVDDRPSFANQARFPQADEVICGDFREVLARLRIGPETYAVVVTRGHRQDEECLDHLLRTEAAYVGSIGSRRRIAIVRERLRESGIPAGRIDELHAPIGLDIGSETPAEIALAILAEITVVRKEREGRLKRKHG